MFSKNSFMHRLRKQFLQPNQLGARIRLKAFGTEKNPVVHEEHRKRFSVTYGKSKYIYSY